MIAERPKTIREWQELFGKIYGAANNALSPKEMWLHLMEEAGEVARDMRKEDYRRLSHDLPDIFAWLCTFANRTGIDVEEAVWDKYPRVCPYCLRERHCVCIAEGFDFYDSARLASYRSHNNMPVTILDWERMFRDIFGNVNQILSRASVGFHLMEEIGEVASLLRKGEYGKYSREIADVFAWLIAIPMKMPEIGSLDEMTWNIYPGLCKRCRLEKCACNGKQVGPRL